MKRFLITTLALSLTVAQVARAENDQERKKHNRQADSAAEARPAPRQSVQQPIRRPQVNQPRTSQHRVAPTQRAVSHAPRTTVPIQRTPVRTETQLEGRNRRSVQPSDRVVTQNRNGNRNVNRSANRQYNRNSYTVARSRVIRTPHDRNWWHSHYNTTFVLFGGGYYYWWDGYWFPAYGYSPYYNNYVYDQPIYGYNNLDPGQVIENVQIALRDAGYYPGAIDGLIGPQTRAALAAFQRDHGLIVTQAVDEPTLVDLGLA